MVTAVWGSVGGVDGEGALRGVERLLGVWEAFVDWKVDY